MGNFLSIPILALAAALQASIVPQFSFLGGRPDLVFLLVIAWSVNRPLEQGIVWAFVGGIMKDLISAAPLGTSALGMVIVVFGVYGIRRQLYSVGLFSLIWIALLGSVFQQIITRLILLFTSLQPAYFAQFSLDVLAEDLTYVIMPTVVYNLVVIFPVYWFVRRIQRRLERSRRLFP